MSIEKRIERIEAILDARGLDWDHPRVEEEPAKEALLDGLPDIRTFAQPNLRWRILEPGEVVCSSDWVNAKSNPPSDPPHGLGWRPSIISAGLTVLKSDGCIYARPVADEPAKEPEHPAGPKPDPGEGYRLLSKDPPEELRDGDEFFHSTLGRWRESIHAGWGYKRQDPVCWYRRKIEVAQPPEPEYREPVLPADAGKVCEFSDDDKTWRSGYLKGFDYDEHRHQGAGWRRNETCSSDRARHRFARIKKDA